MALRFLVLGVLFGICFVVSLAADPSPLQDFCVTDSTSSVHVNGKVCKDPKLVEADDFFFSGLHLPGNTSNAIRFQITSAIIHGFNTLGIAIGRADFAPNGFSPPHTHPRGSEIVLVLEGRIEIGFVTSHPENRLFTKILEVGDFFVVLQGLVHFQRNVGEANAATITAFSSQFPGLIAFQMLLLDRIQRFLVIFSPRLSKLMKRWEARYKRVFLVEYEGGLTKI